MDGKAREGEGAGKIMSQRDKPLQAIAHQLRLLAKVTLRCRSHSPRAALLMPIIQEGSSIVPQPLTSTAMMRKQTSRHEVMRSNETELSDGHRERASLEVKMWACTSPFWRRTFSWHWLLPIRLLILRSAEHFFGKCRRRNIAVQSGE
jgi:hypothetical protein